MTGLSRPGGAARQVERILGRTLVASRAGALVLLAATAWLGYVGADDIVLASLAVGDSMVLGVAAFLSTRWSPWVALDTLCLIVLVAAPLFSDAAGPPAQSPFYLVVLIASVAIGLPDWPLAGVLGAALAVGVANLTVAVVPLSAYPLANAVPDSLSFLAVVLVVWLVARSLRSSAAALDRHHADAVRRSAQLAAERERARQQRVLGGELMATLAALASDHAVADTRLQAHVRSEAQWLDMVVRDGLPDGPPELLDALGQLIADNTGLGLTVTLLAPAMVPRLDPAAVAAVVEASREALTNVRKHAGTASAVIAVSDEAGEVVVEVRDSGQGFDPARARVGTGHALSIRQRLHDAGGRAEINSRPGAGVVVRLRVPGHVTRGGVR